ncbi:Uu.00g064960.m01.CDS01 [Anthostomella pinea]|uniref:Uu.00g064960.m01.CDS01 n=1 Tax=Anthostomella pinea TaxID=933095 RepID=A0AAI8VN29_9PEZI|nr:Uu.00g064960.m01.CDS01 [Anthostomella pinea]
MSTSHNSEQAITHFRLAYASTVSGKATFAEIAAISRLDEVTTRHIIRHAVAQNIFEEPRPGIVSHNAASRIIAEDDALHDWVGAHSDELWQAASQTCNELEKWPRSEEAHEIGFEWSIGQD